MDETIEDMKTREDIIEYLDNVGEGPTIPLDAIGCEGTERTLKSSDIPFETYLSYFTDGNTEEFFNDFDVPSETEDALRKGL